MVKRMLAVALLFAATLHFAGFAKLERKVQLQNVAYGEESPSQCMDVYVPQAQRGAKVNVAVALHGGGWSAGDKREFAGLCKTMVQEAGFLAISMNYRMTGEGATCADMMEDIELALQKVKEIAVEKGLEADSVLLIGSSAGGHLAQLFSYKHSQRSAIPIALCVGLSAPSNLSHPSLMNPLYGDYILQCLSGLTGIAITMENFAEYQNQINEYSPIEYVTPNGVPSLIAHGAKDDLVPIACATSFYEELQDNGVDARMLVFENSGHGLENDPEKTTSLFETMMRMVEEYMLPVP